MKKINPSGKKAQEVFGMSFGMIFSIILIAVFIAAAFLGIRYFLNYQRTIQIGLFIQDLQNDIDTAWNSADSATTFKSTLPTGVRYVCFVNWNNQSINANNVEKGLYMDIKKSGSINSEQNFYIYAPNTKYALTGKKIKHVDLSKHNPICMKVIDGITSIKIIKSFSNPLVEVSE